MSEMTPERYQRVCSLFDAARLLDEGARATFLGQACGPDTDLRDEVQRMLEADLAGMSTPFHAGPDAADPETQPAPPSAFTEGGIVGRRVGPYLIQRLLGSGGMGAVYLALRIDDYRQAVALKLIRRELAGPELELRFRTERQVLARLNHPHIARLLDGGNSPDGHPFLVMEYIDGQPIDRHCDSRQLSVADRVRLLRTVCLAVDYAHQHTVVHRDLKPGNVLVSAQGEPKVVDFGLAKIAGDRPGEITRVAESTFAGPGTLTHTGAILGTPGYMAPEQASGRVREIGPAADVYALGAILYKLLTGRPPFQGNTLLESLQMVCEQEPVPPRRLQPKLPRDLEIICLKCLHKSPDRRYGRAVELADDLERFLDGRPILARPVGPVERFWRVCRRYPLASGLAGLAALLLVVAAVGGVLFAYREQGLRAQTEQINRELESTLYERSIAVAERELTMRQDVARAQSLLESCPEALRGWEWHYLHRQLDGATPPLTHPTGVWCVAFDRSGSRLASGDVSGRVHVWDAATGTELFAHSEHFDETLRKTSGRTVFPVLGVAFSPDGKTLASTGMEWGLRTFGVPRPAVILWDVAAKRRLRSYHGHQSGLVVGVAFSPDGKTVASTGYDRTIHLWDPATGETRHVLTGHTDWVSRPSFRRDGRMLASPSMDGTVRLWDTETGSLVRVIEGQPGPVRDVEFSPDGSLVASAGMDDTVRLWRTDDGSLAMVLSGHYGSTLGLAFSPDGQRLATGGFDKTVKVWDVTTGRETITLRGHTDTVWSLAFSPDGYKLASASFDHTVHVWDATPRDSAEGILRPTGHTDRVNQVAYSPDGRLLASSSRDHTIRLWDAQTGAPGKVLEGHEGHVWGLAFRPDGRMLASVSWDHTVRLWDVATGRQLHKLTGHPTVVHSVAFSPDGRLLASGDIYGRVMLWDVESAREITTIKGQEFLAYSVAFSPDGKTLAVGGGDRTVTLWDVASKKQLGSLVGHDAGIHKVEFDPTGKTLATASWDQTLILWDLATHRPLRTFKGHTDRVHALAFRADGAVLASGSEDKTVRLWDVATGEQIDTPLTHRAVVWGVAFAPQGRRLATASWYIPSGIRIYETEAEPSSWWSLIPPTRLPRSDLGRDRLQE